MVNPVRNLDSAGEPMRGSGPSRVRGSGLAAAGAVAAFALGALTGCGGHDSASHEGHDMATMQGAKTASDASFIAAMVPHHQGAVDMAELALGKAEHPELKAMAASIIASQKAEIATMKSLRQKAGAAPGKGESMGMSDHEMGMDGDMGALAKAEPFDKAFLEMMIPHHEGAVRMARMQLKDGKLPQLDAMAKAIISSQTAEIDQMRRWLKQWYPSR